MAPVRKNNEAGPWNQELAIDTDAGGGLWIIRLTISDLEASSTIST
jgi:hypothetical protein